VVRQILQSFQATRLRFAEAKVPQDDEAACFGSMPEPFATSVGNTDAVGTLPTCNESAMTEVEKVSALRHPKRLA
jgi:hypothetical protein